MKNKVILIGNVGKDPEIRQTKGGTEVANFSLATSENWKDKNTGEKQSRTEWHNITAFAGLASVVSNYIRKGSKIYLEGKIQTDQYEKDGQKMYATKIIMNDMVMLDSKGQGSQPQNSGGVPGNNNYSAADDGEIPF